MMIWFPRTFDYGARHLLFLPMRDFNFKDKKKKAPSFWGSFYYFQGFILTVVITLTQLISLDNLIMTDYPLVIFIYFFFGQQLITGNEFFGEIMTSFFVLLAPSL